MGSPRATVEEIQLLKQYEKLSNQYDAETGGYNITTPASGNTKATSKFVTSSFTPEQGGYYADESSSKYYNQHVATGIVNAAGRYKKAKSAATARKVAATPRKAVNPTISGKRRTARRTRALKHGREGTILTGTLGGSQSDEKKKRKTLLG